MPYTFLNGMFTVYFLSEGNISTEMISVTLAQEAKLEFYLEVKAYSKMKSKTEAERQTFFIIKSGQEQVRVCYQKYYCEASSTIKQIDFERLQKYKNFG